ncbi:MAG TPA: LPS assembly protein LptD, partial [Myxococcota bacterium]|nr:LPS assembly protein LptD [Myxococcota bacterium]
RRLPTGPLAGDTWLTFDLTSLIRPSNQDIAGRDVSRLGTSLDWRDSLVAGPGLVVSGQTGYMASLYGIGDDSTFDTEVARSTPYAAVGLRWPLQRTGTGGVSHLIEPTVSLFWSETSGGSVPNEDSTLVEFDEGNLFAFDRFPGADRREEGLRTAVAVGYTRVDPSGWSLGVTVGRLFAEQATGDFSSSTGLTGTTSDWLFALSYDLGDRFRIVSRALAEDLESVTRSETRLDWAGSRLALGTVYTFAEADLADNRPDPTSEWTLDASYRLNRNWTTEVGWRYDTDEGRPVTAEGELRYENECVRVDLSVSRRYPRSATVSPTTEFVFEVAFGGFGARGDSR